MNVSQWSKQLLLGENLEDKLINPDKLNLDNYSLRTFIEPGRNSKLTFSSKKLKFPKVGILHLDEKKAMALHSFANHELLAIEMMAAALLKFPHETKDQVKLKQGIIEAIKDEQKHLKLYVNRLNDLGYEFGDFPLNDYFWKQMNSLEKFENYLAVMSLTFEAANLDFSLFYEEVFKKLDDKKTATIMKVVYEDEISHVALGSHYLNKWKEDKTLWDYYREVLPWPITPARAKGIKFDKDSRLRAGLGEEFAHQIEVFTGEFQVTKRKSWDESQL
jgi:uncharacterized ferritin-like protein (DUF455 family)